MFMILTLLSTQEETSQSLYQAISLQFAYFVVSFHQQQDN